MENLQSNPDQDKTQDYIRRRDLLLESMKRTRWDQPDPNEITNRRGRKPKIPTKIIIDDPQRRRNKF